MSTTNAPTPFDPPDLPVQAGALSAASVTALSLIWAGLQASYTSQLVGIQAVEKVGGVWRLTVRGYQLAAYFAGGGGGEEW